jgi:hypothetical protein
MVHVPSVLMANMNISRTKKNVFFVDHLDTVLVLSVLIKNINMVTVPINVFFAAPQE